MESLTSRNLINLWALVDNDVSKRCTILITISVPLNCEILSTGGALYVHGKDCMRTLVKLSLLVTQPMTFLGGGFFLSELLSSTKD